MANKEQIFHSFVEKVLSVWSGYQLALDNACGGDETNEKAKWIINVICEYVTTTRSLKTEEFEDWLTNILYHDFDLILEDDSVYQTCCLIMEAFGYIKNENETGFKQLLSGLPSDEEIAKAKKQSVRSAEGDDEDMEMDAISDEDEPEAGESSSEPVTEENRPKRLVKEVDEDGWTTYSRR